MKNDKIQAICVFSSASNNIDKLYFNEAYKMGSLIAQNGYSLVFGGSNLGLMGEAVQGAKAYNADVTGVMPEKLYNLGIHPGDCSKFILTKGMRERKAKMDEISQAVIALAGGFGTLEELSEMIVQKQLGYNNKPIVLVNTNNYYSKLDEFFKQMIKENFATIEANELYYLAKNSKEAIEYINNYSFEKIDYLDKKLNLNQKNQPLV